MRAIFLLLLAGIGLLPVCRAQTTLKKGWIGNDLEYWRIEDSVITIDKRSLVREYLYKASGDTFTLMEYEAAGIIDRPDNRFDFQITKLTRDTLILKSLPGRAIELLPPHDSLLLVDSARMTYPHFRFQKLFFSGTSCQSGCPSLRLEIDSTGRMYFLGRYNTGVYDGYYKGKLSPADFKQLLSMLQHSGLDRFPAQLGDRPGMPKYNFIFYFNGQRRESEGMLVPYFDRELVNFLLNCYKNAGLKKMKQPYAFEK